MFVRFKFLEPNATSPVLLLNEGREKRKKEKTHRVFPRPPLEGGKRRDALVVLVLDLDVEFKIQILI